MTTTIKTHAALDLSSQAFNDLVLRTHGVALVDFWAEWCPPCRVLGPAVEKAAASLEGRALVGKINVDENRELAQSYSISSIPTLVLFKDGVEVARRSGILNEREIVRLVESAL